MKTTINETPFTIYAVPVAVSKWNDAHFETRDGVQCVDVAVNANGQEFLIEFCDVDGTRLTGWRYFCANPLHVPEGFDDPSLFEKIAAEAFRAAKDMF